MTTRFARLCFIGWAVAMMVRSSQVLAFAWGNEGHAIVCEIAFQRLSAEGRALVNEVRALHTSVRDPFQGCGVCAASHPNDGRNLTFSQGCLWPDESRTDTFKDTGEYHFINVPRAASFELLRDCGNLDCALVGIQRFARYLASPPSNSRSEQERRVLALRFLGHFVGDLHQPLHVGNLEDRGGNEIDVRLQMKGPSQTLHSVWDSGVLVRGGLTRDDALDLNAEITATEAAEWGTFSIVDWASEAHTLARLHAYVKPDGSEVAQGQVLDDAYMDKAVEVARLQLKRAGVRLATLIEAVAAGTLPEHLIRVTP
jgi:hypothetical protein